MLGIRWLGLTHGDLVRNLIDSMVHRRVLNQGAIGVSQFHMFDVSRKTRLGWADRRTRHRLHPGTRRFPTHPP
jgi:hypothetical protein